MPQYVCNRDCFGPSPTGGTSQLFVRGQRYEIEPTHPCAIHFDLPKTYRKIVVEAERKRRELTKANQEKRALAKSLGSDMSDLEEPDVTPTVA